MASGQSEGKQRDVFDVDEGRALEALRLAWGDAYVVCFDEATGAGRWLAWRRGGDAMMLAGSTPDELNAAIMADSASRSQP
jgi:hypothetical protein